MGDRTMKAWLSAMLGTKPRVDEPAPGQAGFAANVEDAAWWHVMGFRSGPPRSLKRVEQRFRQLVASAHPDRGGSPVRMQQLLRAREAARRQLTR